MSPGILCTLMTCHGNWAVRLAAGSAAHRGRRFRRYCFMSCARSGADAAPHARASASQSSIALMDKAILPRPPLMVRPVPLSAAANTVPYALGGLQSRRRANLCVLLAAQVAARFSASFESDEMAQPDTALLLTSSVTRVDDAAEPYSVQIAITLSAAPDGSGQARAPGCLVVSAARLHVAAAQPD